MQNTKEHTHTQNSAEEMNQTKSQYGEKAIERKEILGTPFILIITEKTTHIVWGKYRLSHGHDTEKDALRWFAENMWEVIMQVVSIIAINTIKDYDTVTVGTYGEDTTRSITEEVKELIISNLKK